MARGCTSRLKQRPFATWLLRNFGEASGQFVRGKPEYFVPPGRVCIFMGMRADESRNRNDKYGDLDWDQELSLPEISAEYGNTFRHVAVYLPIVQITTAQVFEFLQKRGDKLNELYDKGHHRVGCYPCLLARNSEWEAAARDPVGRRHIERLIQIEEKFKSENNPRKLIKIHPTRDVRALLVEGKLLNPDDDKECGWCSI